MSQDGTAVCWFFAISWRREATRAATPDDLQTRCPSHDLLSVPAAPRIPSTVSSISKPFAYFVTELQAMEQVVSAAHGDPVKGWELLRSPAFAGHPDRARLLCRVCWIALDKGMAQEVH